MTSGTASALVSRTLTPNVPTIRTHWLGRGDNAETYTGGLKYDANNIYLATQYTQTYNATRGWGFANKAQNFEVVAQYQFDFGLRPSVAYLQSKGKDSKVRRPGSAEIC
jgi:predicted porin